MRFRLDVADKDTAQEATIELNARTASIARQMAADAGYLVASCTPLSDSVPQDGTAEDRVTSDPEQGRLARLIATLSPGQRAEIKNHLRNGEPIKAAGCCRVYTDCSFSEAMSMLDLIGGKRRPIHDESQNTRCPKCSSGNVVVATKGFSGIKAIGGAALLGPAGLLAGFVGSGTVRRVCLKCKHTW